MGLLARLVITVLILLTSSLGMWQWHRAEEKQQIMTQLQQRAKQAPYGKADLTRGSNQLQFHPLQLTGRFRHQQPLLLDNQFHQHKVGFHVITAIDVGLPQLILVDRGWVARLASRSELPKIKPILATQTVTGIIYFPQKKLMQLSSQVENPHQWPRIIERVDFGEVEKILNHAVYPFLLVLNENDQNTFIRDWTPAIMPSQRHMAYAVQWFAMSAVLIVILLANLRRASSGE